MIDFQWQRHILNGDGNQVEAVFEQHFSMRACVLMNTTIKWLKQKQLSSIFACYDQIKFQIQWKFPWGSWIKLLAADKPYHQNSDKGSQQPYLVGSYKTREKYLCSGMYSCWINLTWSDGCRKQKNITKKLDWNVLPSQLRHASFGERCDDLQTAFKCFRQPFYGDTISFSSQMKNLSC